MSDSSNQPANRLTKRDHVRMRPGMYISGTDSRALHAMVFEIVDNAINEAYDGGCDQITVTILNNVTLQIEDNGRGIPVDMYADSGRSILEFITTSSEQCNRYDRKTNTFSTGFMGIGLHSINALSETMTVEVRVDGYLWRQTYKTGVVESELQQLRPLEPDERTGTSVTFTPDFTILEPNAFDSKVLSQKLRELAYLAGGTIIRLKDLRPNAQLAETVFYFPGGLSDWVQFLNRDFSTLSPPIYGKELITIKRQGGEPFDALIEFAFQYTDTANVFHLSFANTIEMEAGGSHLNAVWRTIAKVFTHYVNDRDLFQKSNFAVVDILPGLTTVVHVRYPNPRFQAKHWIGVYELEDKEVGDAVAGITLKSLISFAKENPESLQDLWMYWVKNKNHHHQRRFGISPEKR